MLKNFPGALPCLCPVACNSAKLVFMEFYTGEVLIEFITAFQFLLRSNSDSRHVDLCVFLNVHEA
jgi:hypothetical protein